METSGIVINVEHGVTRKCQDAHGVQRHDHNPKQHRQQSQKKMAKRRVKKTKGKSSKPKQSSIPVINRRLFRLASLCCRERAKFKCEICGMKVGDLHANTGKPQRVEAHHIMSRSNKDSPLKFDIRNLVCLCTEHHKTGKYSAHKHGLWFSKEFIKIRPDDAEWILEHSDDYANLKDREVLKNIEECLRKDIPLKFGPKPEEDTK